MCASINRNSLERHREQPPVYRIEIGARAERVAQLIGRGAQALTPQRGDRRWIAFRRPQRPAASGAHWPLTDPTPDWTA